MPIDILFLLSLSYGLWQGFHHGFISTIFNVAIYVFGITLAFKVTPTTANIMSAMFHSENPTIYLTAFIVNVALIVIIFKMAAKSLEKVLDFAYMGVLNHVLGAVVSAFFYVLICSVIIWFLAKAQILNPQTIADSRSYTLMEPLPTKAYNIALRLKPYAEEAWNTSVNWMDRLEKYGEQKTQNGQSLPSPDNGGAKIYKPDASKPIEKDPATASRPNHYPPEDSDGIEE